MAKLSHLKDLYLDQLRDLYSAESQLVQALPKMAAAATDPQLKESFERHLGQTQVQLERLQSLFQTLNEQPGGHTCKAMQGIIAEGEDMIRADATSAVKDAGLIASAQRAEHYEIAGYGTVVRYAEVLGQADQARVLRTTESEEKDTDLALTALAGTLNQRAAQG